jgi:adenosylhomocysteine nucleosidase
MPRVAIVSAMQQELQALLALMPDERPLQRGGRRFWHGHLQGHEVVAVLSGIGKVAAATTATLLITEFAVDVLVFTGSAGGLADGVCVGDMVVADALLQHDMDASPLFPRHEVPLYGTDRFTADVDLSDALARAAQAALDDPAVLDAGTRAAFGIAAPRVHRGLVVSGDRFVSGRAENTALRECLPQALAVEMEGAALAQVCHDFGRPFAVLRCVSDRADDAAHHDFSRFVAQVASRCTLAVLQRWLDGIGR